MKHFVRILVFGIAASLLASSAYASTCSNQISDVFLWGNTAANGSLEIFTLSDPINGLTVGSGTLTFAGNTYLDTGNNFCESNASGGFLIGGVPGTNLSWTLLSDGEKYFDPCSAGFDTSDCVTIFGATPTVEPGSPWVAFSGGGTWVLPAGLPSETPGYWLYSGLATSGANGYAILYEGTPEPSSLLLFGSGILGLMGVVRRRLF